MIWSKFVDPSAFKFETVLDVPESNWRVSRLSTLGRRRSGPPHDLSLPDGRQAIGAMPPRVTVVNAPLPWRAGVVSLLDPTKARRSRPISGLDAGRAHASVDRANPSESHPESFDLGGSLQDGNPNPKEMPSQSNSETRCRGNRIVQHHPQGVHPARGVGESSLGESHDARPPNDASESSAR
jgi:hypothetical protein